MTKNDPVLTAYYKFSNYVLADTFEQYEKQIQIQLGIIELSARYLANMGNPIYEKVAIETWINDPYSNFDSVTMGYSRDSAKKRIEAIQKKYNVGYGIISNDITTRILKKIERISKNACN